MYNTKSITLELPIDVRRKIIDAEGSYDDIEEWEEEPITVVNPPETMYVMVKGAPKAPNHDSVDEILKKYLAK